MSPKNRPVRSLAAMSPPATPTLTALRAGRTAPGAEQHAEQDRLRGDVGVVGEHLRREVLRGVEL
jgi:hypothetical protein